MQPGLIPYSVNSPLWSDGAHKERYLALPGESPKIEFTNHRAWGLSDQTVIVKSFALEMEEGNPASRRYVETRFLTKQEGEWVGYSYLWNDEQTDATLVAKEGADRKFSIRTPRGPREQTWRYPSRSECMVCHSRAAGFVLGLTTLQMNKDHDYGGVVDHQLRVLEHLGLFKVNWQAEATADIRKELEAAGLNEKKVNERIQRATATRGQREAGISPLLARLPEQHVKLVDPYDPKQDLTQRARSYLHANCSQCHVEAGGGNAQIDLEFTTQADKMKLLDVRPLHHTFGLTEARLVAPGDPGRSVLLHRVSHRGQGQMPQLATTLVDQPAAALLREWIKSLKK
jgi:hypothetical protein